jgi:hypothetical protein
LSEEKQEKVEQREQNSFLLSSVGCFALLNIQSQDEPKWLARRRLRRAFERPLEFPNTSAT